MTTESTFGGELRLLFLAAMVSIGSLSSYSHAGEDNQRALTRIALGSCARQNQPQPIWDAVVASKRMTEATITRVKFNDWPNRHRIGTVDWTTNFGVIEFNWASKDPLIRLQIRDGVGDICLQQKIVISEVQPQNDETDSRTAK